MDTVLCVTQQVNFTLKLMIRHEHGKYSNILNKLRTIVEFYDNIFPLCKLHNPLLVFFSRLKIQFVEKYIASGWGVLRQTCKVESKTVWRLSKRASDDSEWNQHFISFPPEAREQDHLCFVGNKVALVFVLFYASYLLYLNVIGRLMHMYIFLSFVVF